MDGLALFALEIVASVLRSGVELLRAPASCCVMNNANMKSLSTISASRGERSPLPALSVPDLSSLAVLPELSELKRAAIKETYRSRANVKKCMDSRTFRYSAFGV